MHVMRPHLPDIATGGNVRDALSDETLSGNNNDHACDTFFACALQQ